jgi:hypothetical protein
VKVIPPQSIDDLQNLDSKGRLFPYFVFNGAAVPSSTNRDRRNKSGHDEPKDLPK